MRVLFSLIRSEHTYKSDPWDDCRTISSFQTGLEEGLQSVLLRNAKRKEREWDLLGDYCMKVRKSKWKNGVGKLKVFKKFKKFFIILAMEEIN